MNEIPESQEVSDEGFWRRGANFHWCWPHFDVVRPANTKPRFLWNRYPHNVIGAMVIAFGRGWGIRWKDTRPRRSERRRRQAAAGQAEEGAS